MYTRLSVKETYFQGLVGNFYVLPAAVAHLVALGPFQLLDLRLQFLAFVAPASTSVLLLSL